MRTPAGTSGQPLLSGGASADPNWGTLGVGAGGTGLTSGTSGGVLGFTASGALASSAALAVNALMLGGGAGATPSAMGSLGTTSTVLHGNASGAPSFGAVNLASEVTATLGTANGGTGLANGDVLLSDISFVIDGGGSTIATGIKGYLGVDFPGNITQATLLGDRVGNIVVNVYKTTYANFDAGSTHPVSGDKITSSAPPTIANTTKSQDSTLTGWTTSFSAGDVFAFNVDSVVNMQRVSLILKVQKS